MSVSASGLGRAVECPASVALPQVESTSAKADRGRICHRFLEVAITDRDKALAEVPFQYRQWCADIDVKAIHHKLAALRPEIPMALHPTSRTARELARTSHRDYAGLMPGEIPGTADLLATMHGGDLHVVIDYKTGQDVTPAAENLQLKFFATGLHLLRDARVVLGRLVYIHDDGSHHVDEAEFTALDFDETMSTLADLTTRLQTVGETVRAGRAPDVKVGDHCRYCQAFTACPAQTGLAKRIVPELADIEGRIAAMTPAEAGKAWGTYTEAKRILDAIEKGLKGYAKTTPLTLASGKVVRAVATTRRSIDGERALALLREYGASDATIASCVNMVTFDTVREVKGSGT